MYGLGLEEEEELQPAALALGSLICSLANFGMPFKVEEGARRPPLWNNAPNMKCLPPPLPPPRNGLSFGLNFFGILMMCSFGIPDTKRKFQSGAEKREGKRRRGKSNNNTELEAAAAREKAVGMAFKWPFFLFTHIQANLASALFLPFPSLSPGRAECTQQIRPCKTKEAAFVTSLNFEL